MDYRIQLKKMRGDGFLKKILESENNRIKKVSATVGWLNIRSCPVCSSTKNKFLFEYNTNLGLRLNRCLNCELVYFSSRPSDLSSVYEDHENLQSYKNSYLNNVEYRISRFATERIEIIKSQVSGMDSCSLLDVGCGIGWFLEAAQNSGFNVSGYELSKNLARFTSDRLGIKVYYGDLENISTKYHVITAFDVLEHVANPVQFVNQLKNLLHNNGVILFFTPNTDSLAFGVGGQYNNLILPTLHLTYFNKASIYELAKITKLKVVYFETRGMDIGDIKSLSEWNRTSSLNLEKWQALADTLQPKIDALGLGNHLRTTFKKS